MRCELSIDEAPSMVYFRRVGRDGPGTIGPARLARAPEWLRDGPLRELRERGNGAALERRRKTAGTRCRRASDRCVLNAAMRSLWGRPRLHASVLQAASPQASEEVRVAPAPATIPRPPARSGPQLER